MMKLPGAPAVLLIVAALTLGVLVSAPAALAVAQAPAEQSSTEALLATIEQLRNQIKLLQDQLTELRSEVAAVREEVKITKNLYKGITDSEVKEVQKFLKQFSEIYPEGLVTGYYGPLTEKAVKKFQERENLPATGKIDPTTRERMNDYLAGGTEKKVVVCHLPPENPGNKQSLEISESALEAHLAHGDALGACKTQPITISPAPESVSTKPAAVPATPVVSEKTGTPTVENKEFVVSSVSVIVRVTGDENVVLCALTKNGLVYCRYDSGSFMNMGLKPTGTGGFVAVPGLTNVASITSFDNNRICVVKTDGTALCWGNNSYGQLGDGTLVAKTEPTQVFGLGPGTTASISMGRMHACALKIDGSVVCWGSNDTGSGGGGQIGHGDKTETIRLFPTQVSGLGPKSTVALYSTYNGTCAIKTDNSVVCWGEIHPIGSIGIYAPVKISQNLGAIRSLTVGWKTTFALKANGSVVGWGQNYCGQLGDGTKEGAGTPIQVTGLGPGSTVAIATSFMHSCALKTDGSVACWGCSGTTGDGTILNRYTPVQPIGLGAGTTASLADNASCAVKIDGSAVCWSGGQIPTPVPGL
ncbi:MAG: peptidoglycan-binding protein [Candidatus Jorgensenbacteria bacterium]